jgi:CRISPR type III-A-associated RAMP protein Csm5
LSERILERYSLEITTLSPVYVGDGGRLTPLDYLEKDRVIHVINEDKLFEELERRGLVNDFINYVERARDASLKDFVERFMRGVGPRVYESMTRYSLEILSGRGEGKQILTFIRNAEGRAYIPGSEVKGAMRIALMHSILEGEPARASRILGMLASDQRDEDVLLRPRIGEPHGDLGRLIRPSDSSPIDRVCVAQMYRVSTRLDKPIPLSLVGVIPGNVATRASLTLVSSERIIGEIGGPVSIQDIVDACMRRTRKVIELEKRRIQRIIQGASRSPAWADLNKFYDNLQLELDQCKELEAVLRIGGGQGLYSTTLIPALIDDKNFRMMMEMRGAEAGRRLKEVRGLLSHGRPYNVKAVDVNGKLMPLGWVRVVFREA